MAISPLWACPLPEFACKRAAEATWPQTTDSDRLDAASEALIAHGIIALQNMVARCPTASP